MVGVCPLPHSQGRLSVAAYSVSKAQGSGLKCATSSPKEMTLILAA